MPADGVMILEATGHTMVYVNGEPRTGDPYGNGIVRLPVALKKGENEFLFLVGRGRLQAKLVAAPSEPQLDTHDLTLPDYVRGEHQGLPGGGGRHQSDPEDAGRAGNHGRNRRRRAEDHPAAPDPAHDDPQGCRSSAATSERGGEFSAGRVSVGAGSQGPTGAGAGHG